MNNLVFHRARGRRRGFALVLFTLSALVLFGFLGLVIDGGRLQIERRRAQTAADAAAAAAIVEYMRTGNSANAITDGSAAATLNGFTDGTAGATVAVASAGVNRYQASVARTVPTYFMNVLGASAVTVSASAVGGLAPGGGGGCVFVLGTGNIEGALRTDGSSGLNTNCGIYVNSSHSAKAALSEGTVVSSWTKVVGGVTGAARFTPAPLTGQGVMNDPLSYLPDASVPSGCDNTNLSVGANAVATLYPGVYCGGIRVGQNANVTFSAGVYYLKGGGIDTKGFSVIEGDDVVFIQTSPSTGGAPLGLLLESNTTATLRAPRSGPWTGILWFSRHTMSQPNDIQSATVARLEGAIYTPNQDFLVQGASQASQYDSQVAKYTIMVARTIRVNGSGSAFRIRSDYSELEGGSPLKRPAIVQ